MVAGLAGTRRYLLYQPPGHRTAPAGLVVMLHGCAQDARSFAASTRMNRLAAMGGFLVLYPEQERMANAHGCWNWFETRSGQAQREAASILLAVEQVCTLHRVDRNRVLVAGMSAGAGMAALLALSYPARFAAVAMHSGVGPGLAHSGATALAAMHGRRSGMRKALVPGTAGTLPALLVIQGTADPVVASVNGLLAARRWAAMVDAAEGAARRIQKGGRHPVLLTDWTAGRRVVVTLASVQGLGHAWSGGPASHAYSDPAGPDASRMVWAFAKRVFARTVG
jgi:poly(hydroxyalkanoate) depolymerase family esterase